MHENSHIIILFIVQICLHVVVVVNRPYDLIKFFKSHLDLIDVLKTVKLAMFKITLSGIYYLQHFL